MKNKLITVALMFLLAFGTVGCGDKAARNELGKQSTLVIVPSKGSFYPSDLELKILTIGFSSTEMKWSADEVSRIEIHRSSLAGLFNYMDQKVNTSYQVPFSDLKSTFEQGRYHYKELKKLLDSKRKVLESVYEEAFVIYVNRINVIEDELARLELYTQQKEYDIRTEAEAFDFSIFGKFYSAVEPLVGALL